MINLITYDLIETYDGTAHSRIDFDFLEGEQALVAGHTAIV